MSNIRRRMTRRAILQRWAEQERLKFGATGRGRDESKSIAYMRELRDYMANRLAILETVEREWAEQDPGYPDALSDAAFYPQLTLVLGIRKFRTTLEWCDECIARIHARTQRRAKAG